MAIKVTGTTVINDSRGLENVADTSQFIKKPTITSPTNGETDVAIASGLTIEGTVYDALISNTRDYREVQVDLSTGDFSTPVVTQQENSDSIVISAGINFSESYKVRIRDVDTDGNATEFSDEVSFTTEADPFATVGTATSGGFYLGRICAAGTCYNLIVAPNATGCVECQWKTSETSTLGTCSDTDGFANTYPALENSTHPAGNWTATRTIGGFSDWYLPSIVELEVFYNNGGGNGSGDPLPSGEDFFTDNYWSSTELNVSYACNLNFSNGNRCCFDSKGYLFKVRAVRRVPI